MKLRMISSNNISIAQIHKSFGYYERYSKEYIFSEIYFDLKNHDLTRKDKPKILLDNIYLIIVIQDWYFKNVVIGHILKVTSKIGRFFHE